MKKLLALLMAVAVTFQLVTPVFADTEGTEETTAPTEDVVETETPTEAPAEETTAPTEETAAPTEETSAPTEATEETEEATEETVEDIALFADDGDVIASGECGKNGDNLTWVLTGDGTLTISGSGDIADFSKEKESNDGTDHTTAPWSRYYCGCDRIRSDRNWRFSFLRLHRLGQRNNSGWRNRNWHLSFLWLLSLDRRGDSGKCDQYREICLRGLQRFD